MTSTERYRARLLATRLRSDSATLRKIAVGRLAKLVASFAAAGWSPSDVLHALDLRPDGTAHINTDTVHCPPGWVRWRLGHWCVNGAVVASRSQRSVPGWRWPVYETGEISPVPARPWETRAYDGPQPGPRFSDPKGEVRRIIREGAQRRRAEAQRRTAEGTHFAGSLSAHCPQLAALENAFVARRVADAEQRDRETRRLELASPILSARSDNARRDMARLRALTRARKMTASKGVHAVDSLKGLHSMETLPSRAPVGEAERDGVSTTDPALAHVRVERDGGDEFSPTEVVMTAAPWHGCAPLAAYESSEAERLVDLTADESCRWLDATGDGA